MTDNKSIKPVEPSKKPGTPVPKCFDNRLEKIIRNAKCGRFSAHKKPQKVRNDRKK